MENIDHQDNMAEEDLTEDPSDKNEFFEEMNFGQKMVELWTYTEWYRRLGDWKSYYTS